MSDETVVPDGLGLRPHSARIYDYFLGGKTNYSVDRKLAGEAFSAYPNAMVAARENRAFMHRAVRYLGREMGLRQFLDIGTGIPTEPNLHQVAQAEHEDARIVYSDNDPIVLAHARALMTGSAEGTTDYIEADVREPDVILEHAYKSLDFDQPIALSLIALFHFVPDSDAPDALVRRLLEELPSGSALALSHGTCDLDPDIQRLADSYQARGLVCRLRSHEEVLGLFEGLTMIEPGLVATCDWRPELDDGPRLPGTVESSEVGAWAGLGVKP